MTRIGGFPRLNRLSSPAKAATPTAVDAKPVPAPVSDVEPEFDDEGRLLIKAPIAPLPRRPQTILYPKPVHRVAPPPMRPSGASSLPRPVLQPPSGPRPVFQPPTAAPQTQISRPSPVFKPPVRRQPGPQPLTPDDIPWK